MPRKPDLSIIGQTYNSLKVISYTDHRNSYGSGLYLCQCLLCGGERLATRANLLRGEIKDCGCSKHKPRKEETDLRGQIFGRLKVEDIVTINEKMHYICTCQCGNKTTVLPQSLVRGTTRSCGCLYKGQDAKIKDLFIDGTAPSKLRSDKLRSTNTSGVTGVWYSKSRGRWCAEIMFRRKKYSLGRYDRKEDAIAIRKEAEKQIWGPFLDWYRNLQEEQTMSKQITDKQFMDCVSEVWSYTDRDAYISDLCLSSMWDDAEGADIPSERIEALGAIWDACHRSVKEIAADAGLSGRKLAERFCIPYRTVEDWSAGKRECPVYTRLMMQECLGLLHR